MGKVCELCNTQNAEEYVEGVNLCRNCVVKVKKMFLDDEYATRTLANAANYPNATEKALKNIINNARGRLSGQHSTGSKNEEALEILGYRKKNSDSQSINEKTIANENRKGTATQQGNNPVTFSGKVENNKSYNMKYIKVLSTSEKREWIENYISIKKFVAGIYALIGLLLGILIAYILSFGMGGYIICILICCGIASALGTNAVGTAMMEAITAEQSIITEELLTELLNNSQKE